MTLTQEQMDTYWQNGFLRFGPLLKADEIATLRTEYDRVFVAAQTGGGIRNLSAGDGPAAAAPAQQQVLQIMFMYHHSLQFAKLLYDKRILDIVEDLIGPNIMVFHDQALWKPAYTGGAVFWHQDNAYWKCRPATLVSCWLTLDDVTRENGAMQVIPGSHLKPVWHAPSKATNALLELKVDNSQAVVVDLPAGGIMFHHCQTLHYTQPNATPHQRRAYAIHFMPAGTRGSDGTIIPVGHGTPLLRAGL